MGGSVFRKKGTGRLRSPGQVLVIFAVFLAVGVVILQLSLFLYSALRQKAAAEEVARAAARAGCSIIDRDTNLIVQRPWLNAREAVEAARDVLRRGLSHLPYGLAGGATVEDILAAETTEISARNSLTGCSTSPISGIEYCRPFVYVCFTVPTEAFFLPVDIRVCAEDAVEMRAER